MIPQAHIINLDVQYSEEEYLAAHRLYIFQSFGTLVRLLVTLLLITGLFLILPLIFGEGFPLWATLSLTALVDGALAYQVLLNVPRRFFRGDPKFRDKYQITFTDQGVEIKTKQIDSKLAWSLYTKVVEGDGLYLLIYGKDTRTMTVIPKRAFTSRTQENEFREMLARHINDHSALRHITEGDDGEEKYNSSPFTPPDWR